MSSSSSSLNKCYNSECTELRSESSTKGWRLRSGEFAELCTRCGCAYEEGRYCEAVHFKASGWRSCESCGKRIHCGCIVSVHTFMLLDAGGIECMPCARKNPMLTTNSVQSSPSLLLPMPISERLQEMSTKWTQISGAGPVPWRQAPSLFSTSLPQSDLHPRIPYEADMTTNKYRLNGSVKLLSSTENKNIENFSNRLTNGILYNGIPEIQENGHPGLNYKEQVCLPANDPPHMTLVKDDPPRIYFGLPVPNASENENNGQNRTLGTHSRPTSFHSLANQYPGSTGGDSSGVIPIRGRPRGEGRGKSQLLSRYCPMTTDQELQQLSGHPNFAVTPLFEKVLSVSDVGKIGRLVLPKKCAEAHLPQITETEGLPLKVQDAKGQEWVFQYRFWPNNHSRMYVLEGVALCLQSMQVQAGDIVTFSRSEPEGKLLMGFRKASTAPSSDQGSEINMTSNRVPKHEEAELVYPTMTWSKVDKSGYTAKDAPVAISPAPKKRKNNTFSLRSKRLQIDNIDQIKLKISWGEAQGLLRPPNHIPSVVVIEGFEFEEYQDGPVIGRPTIFTTGRVGENIQWAQCEDCCKWRKLPPDALLSSRWTCSQNVWDSERSICSAAQDSDFGRIDCMGLPANTPPATCKDLKAVKQDPGGAVKALEGLDSEEIMTWSSSYQAATTKHPRHRPGCTCIVCIQSPSGKNPKHQPDCTCELCLALKRRLHNSNLKRGGRMKRNQSEKDGETVVVAIEKQDDDENPESNENMKRASDSPFKAQIDLNIQPERDEETSPPTSDMSNMMKVIDDATERCLEQQRLLLNSDGSSSTLMMAPEGHQVDGVSIKLEPTHHTPYNNLLSADAAMLESLQPRDR